MPQNKIPEESIGEARNVDMVEFLTSHYGFTFKSVGGGYRPKEHESLHVNTDRKRWYWHSMGIGGFGAIDFLMKVEDFTFQQAVEGILNRSFAPAPTYIAPPVPKNLELPPKAQNSNKLYWYLCDERKLDPSIVGKLEQNGLIYQDTKNNVVFVGMNEENIPKFACIRGTYLQKPYRKDCTGSDKAYSFHMTYHPSPRLYVFEAPIDCISHASLENLTSGTQYNPESYLEVSRLSLGGTSPKALDGYLKRFPQVKELVFCLDNDTVGGRTSSEFAKLYWDKGYQTRIELPTYKDYNEMLVHYLQELNSSSANGKGDLNGK
ncbi:MAG: DUF3991 domain-containing protein [Eubacteriales bacterium]